MSIGDNIRRFRRKAGMPQQELGRRLGVSGSMVGQWECGTRSPKYETVCQIAQALGVTAQKLLDNDDPTPDDMPNGTGKNDLTVGQRIGDLASEKNINLHQLAKMAGVSYNTLYAIVKRKSDKIDRDIVQKVASALGVSVDVLFGLPSSVPPLDSSADECEYVRMLRHYQEDLPDDALLDEAIATLESYFSHMDKAALLHFSRPLAIAYLALKHERGERAVPSHWTGDKECYSCGRLALYNGNEELVSSRFCPHCGAPMDNHK